MNSEQLDKRAEELANSAHPYFGKLSDVRMDGYRHAARIALEVHAESLRLLETAYGIAVRDNNEAEDPSVYGEAIQAHITTLRKLLGVDK